MSQIDYTIAFQDGKEKDPKRDPSLFIDTWLNNGFNAPTQTQLTYKDLIATPNASHWLPKAVEVVAREPIEPMLIIPRLLDRINVAPATTISMPSLGAIVAADIGEAESYPEEQLQVTPGTVTSNVGKSGVAFTITEEMMAHSMFDVMNLHIRHGRRALDRHKEKKGMNYLSGMGVSLFDNVEPLTSIFGTCTGRAMDGTGNGSCRMEDLLNAYSFVMMQGFIPNTILLHPLAWSIWMSDPLLKSIVRNTGNGSWFQPHNMAKQALFQPQSKIGPASSYGSYVPPGNAASATPTSISEIDQNLQSAAIVPSYFPYPLQVLVSPFMPFYFNNNTCDIMICDANNLGALPTEYDVRVDNWDDLSNDTMKIKMKEKYGFFVYEQGNAIGVMRNIPLVPNEIVLPLQGTISSSGSLDALTTTTAITGL